MFLISLFNYMLFRITLKWWAGSIVGFGSTSLTGRVAPRMVEDVSLGRDLSIITIETIRKRHHVQVKIK